MRMLQIGKQRKRKRETTVDRSKTVSVCRRVVSESREVQEERQVVKKDSAALNDAWGYGKWSITREYILGDN